MGNLGADAELRVTSGGQPMLKMRLATTETWKDGNGEKKERTDWHRCTLWGKRAEALAKHLTKGTKILVEGRIQYDQYEKDGQKMYSTDINVTNVVFCGGGNKGQTAATDDTGSSNDDDEQEPPF
jgi:single-strand DNA-binding protein